jgi:hypothetical protein
VIGDLGLLPRANGIVPLIIQWERGTSSDVLRRSARWTKCRDKAAALGVGRQIPVDAGGLFKLNSCVTASPVRQHWTQSCRAASVIALTKGADLDQLRIPQSAPTAGHSMGAGRSMDQGSIIIKFAPSPRLNRPAA